MDFKNLTAEIIATGLTQQELADMVPCSQSTIAAFLGGTRGSRPSLNIGTRLLALHRERCAAVQPSACEVRRMPTAANLK